MFAADRLRRRDDRPRRDQEPVDLPPDRRATAGRGRGGSTEPTLADRRDSHPRALRAWSPSARTRPTPSTSCASSPAGTPTACRNGRHLRQAIQQIPDVPSVPRDRADLLRRAARRGGGLSSTLERSLAIEAGVFERRLSEHAEAWGAVWQAIDASSGDLDLPVVAGIRRGFRRYRLTWQSTPLVLRALQTEEQLTIQRGSLMLLVVGGLGGVASVLWPFYPGLLAVVPLGSCSRWAPGSWSSLACDRAASRSSSTISRNPPPGMNRPQRAL